MIISDGKNTPSLMFERHTRFLRRHRPYVLIALFFLVSLQLIYLHSRTPNSPLSPSGSLSSSSSTSPRPPSSKNGLKVVLVNSPRYHFEVVAPLLYTLANQGTIVSSLELVATQYGSTRLGVRPVLQAQLPKATKTFFGKTIEPIIKELKIREPKELGKLDYKPDLMVLTSCSRDLEDMKNTFYFDPNHDASPKEIICLLHEAVEWQETSTKRRKMIQPWIDAGRVSFLVLSPHVGDYVQEHITNTWNMTTLLDDHWDISKSGVRLLKTFVPVFEDKERFLETPWSNITGPFAAIPGKYEPMRRNYKTIFDHMLSTLPLLQRLNGTLRLTGYGDWPPEVPPALSTHVYLHSHYMFPQYFSLLSQAMAMMPAFATHKYFEDRASSTIATSVIAGVPLVATRELLSKYRYLEEDGAWIQEEGEEEVVRWLKVMEMDKREWVRRKEKVKALRKRLIKENLENMGDTLADVRYRLERRGWL